MELNTLIYSKATQEWVQVKWWHIKMLSENPQGFFNSYGFIEITADILEVFGFSVSNDRLYAELVIGTNWKLEWYKNMLGFSICKGNKGKGIGNIKHLHQLQTLYFLLTNEKRIVM